MSMADTETAPADRLGRRRLFRTALVAAVAGTAVLIAVGGGWRYVSTASDAAAASSAVSFTGATDEIVRGDIEESVTITGTLRYAQRRTVSAGGGGTVTALPEPGSTVTRGDRLYAIDNAPAVLLRGDLPAWRDFASGMSDGPDVRQLEENLRDLGYFSGEPDYRFRWATTEAIMAWQKAQGLPRTGSLPLGSVVFSPADLRVGAVDTEVGSHVGPGAALFQVTSTKQIVQADVRLADQRLAVLGTVVTVRLPGGTATEGSITSVGTPTEVQGSDGQRRTVIPVVVSLTNPAEAAKFQEASVTMDVPSERRVDVLSVPVGALIALDPQQYGVEVVNADGSTVRVPVETGLFAGGRVEISGDGIAAGQRVLVPQR